ncbi:MAG: GNAT family N-acetyltransferase [Cellulophaga sp.]
MFLTDLHYSKDVLSQCCKNITYDSDEALLNDVYSSESISKEALVFYAITNVPEYIHIKYKDSYSIKKFSCNKGYSICLNDSSDVNTYLKEHFQNKGKPIKKSLKRLEACFDITYKMFYGEITKKECDSLLHLLKEMIAKRFQQRQEKSSTIAQLDLIITTANDLINTKKASLFVIYHESKPIEIAFNYHYDKILFAFISSYDLDYSKFSLGNIEIYKQVDWCIQNKYDYFDMGWGNLEYKRRWSNNIYTYKHYYVYPEKSISGYFIALLKGCKTILIAYYLASKNINVFYNKLKKIGSKKETVLNDSFNYKIDPIEKGVFIENQNCMDLSTKNNQRFKELINNFLYSSQENHNNVKLFLFETNKYVIQGINSFQKITIISANESSI